ncbi:MAG: 3'-5' exonuclease [Paludibacteraceae bacterium]|jgi:DNA polymerase-3 subunit epsilon|nr:3'-5' exonuclease [Paludibacteraceae bacterium]MBP5642452.1 3'-5' exonuclease [Paludibacteraceae bacterium]
MTKLNLTRPLVFFDLETTGVNIGTDRIVEISYIKLFPDGHSEGKTYRVKPTMLLMGQEVAMHIPDEASAVHGIHDEDVANCPTFKELAPEIADAMRDCDLAGYNSNRFDVPLLAEEFMRAGVDVDLKKAKLVDAFTIFQKKEPRNLTAAYKFYCGKDLEGAHAANADITATLEVLEAQLERYDDLPTSVDELAAYTGSAQQYADFAGRIIYNEKGVECFNFGKYKGMPVIDVFRRDPSYYSWIKQGDFPEYTKGVCTRIYLSK